MRCATVRCDSDSDLQLIYEVEYQRIVQYLIFDATNLIFKSARWTANQDFHSKRRTAMFARQQVVGHKDESCFLFP